MNKKFSLATKAGCKNPGAASRNTNMDMHMKTDRKEW